MKKQLFNLRTMVIALGILISGAANAFTAVTSGNWSSAATWGGTAPGNTVSNADIIIPAGITVTLDADVTFSGLLSTFSVTGTLSSTTMNNLTLTQGALAGNGIISIRRLAFTNVATASFTGNMTVNELMNSSLLVGFVGTANITDSLILESGSLMLNTNSNLIMMTNSTVRVNNGTIGIGGGIFGSTNNYNVMYVGTSKNTGIELNSSTVQTIKIKMNSNSESVSLNNNTTVNTNLDVTMGRLNLNGRALILKGDLNMSAGTFLVSNSASDLSIQGSGALTSALMFSSNSSLNALTIDRSGATVKLATGLNVNGNMYLLNGAYSLESGSTLTMNSGSTIHVGAGSLANAAGTFVGTASYNVEYMGATNASSGVELTGSGLNNINVNYTSPNSGVSLTSSLAVNGSLNMNTGHVLLNGNNLVLNGTLSQNSNATIIGHPNSELHLNLTSVANTTLYFDNTSAANNTVSKLKINLNTTTPIMLGSQLNVRNELMFVKGRIMIDNSDLIIQSSGSITGFDDTRYVVTSGTGSGRLQMNVAAGSSFVTFPVGTSVNYSPAHIQQNAAATTGDFMIRTMNEVYTAGYTGWNNANSSAVVGRTWLIEAASGVNVNMNLKLGWMAAAELNGFNRNNAMIRHYTSGSWDVTTAAAASSGAANTYEMTRAGITSLSPFAVADASAPVGIKNNVTSALGFDVYPNPAKDLLIVDLATTMQGYKYEVIDITGKSIKEGTTSQNSKALDVSSLKPGYYFIKVTNLDDNVSGVKRFVKD